MKHSAGIIPFRIVGDRWRMEFFVGHPTGQQRTHWNFLKGQVEDGESVVDAAIREFEEESGLRIRTGNIEKLLMPLGSVMQNPGKKVTAFGIHYPNIDPSECHSNKIQGTDTPEIDGYRWIPYEELIRKTHPSHVVFYEKLTDLGKWL